MTLQLERENRGYIFEIFFGGGEESFDLPYLGLDKLLTP